MQITMRSPVVVDDQVVAAIAELTRQATTLLPLVDDLARRYYEVESTVEAAITRRVDREEEDFDGAYAIVSRATGLDVLQPLMEDLGRALDASLGGTPSGHPSWYEPMLAKRLAETEEG